jgi:hypothetical protein
MKPEIHYCVDPLKRVDEEDLKGLAAAIKQGIEQTAEYSDLCGAEEANLMVFDRRPRISWGKKIYVRGVKSEEGRQITLWGC